MSAAIHTPALGVRPSGGATLAVYRLGVALTVWARRRAAESAERDARTRADATLLRENSRARVERERRAELQRAFLTR
ncbi:hypothetical protein GCM10027515_18040 [Schumannella luteola]|uniref:Uncharacterized protein n=1 Tax=Schumannella luteola TaxID=472059 RepID=A0A852YRR9_9MICO|nr:hypothetical protein [Schumannella luteola]NYH00400.1 hypothetical protein [Schumannella luteola]TPX03686.1 hypothetical protein FJ656_16080 [Schumannella luteola]